MSELHGIARFKLHEGKIEEFKRLSAQCMEIVRAKETGTLQYDIYISEDQSECIVHEAYQDSAALIEHLANLGDLMQAILATGSVSGELLGDPSPELRAKMAGGEVRLFTPFLSMQTESMRSRWFRDSQARRGSPSAHTPKATTPPAGPYGGN